tara:strand:- start:2703 stop:3086 length:384 start_codon:yes stop_codon:yes gene_type:complete
MKKENLKSILTDLNEEYFDGKAEVKDIRIMKQTLRNVFGRFNTKTKDMEINSILIKDKRVLRFIIYHELCHSVVPFNNSNPHTQLFMRLFKRYKNYKKEHKYYLTFIAKWWITIGYLTKKDLVECGV